MESRGHSAAPRWPWSGRRWPVALVLAAAVVWLLGGAAPEVAGQAPTPTATPFVRPGGRFEESDLALIFAGPWTIADDARASGGSFARSDARGAYFQLTFPGPNVRWVTTRGPNRGIARVFIDGEDRGTIDLFAPAEQFGQEFSWGGLAGDQNHAVRIEVTGLRSGASAGSNVDVDAFIVVGAVISEALRFEDTDLALRYSGSWARVTDGRASGGAFQQSNQAGAAVEFTFTGPNVRWVTVEGPDRGIARVLIDGREANPSSVNLFAPDPRFQTELSWGGLAGDQTHTIRIEVTGQRSGPATNSFVPVDAFVVLGAPVTPVPTPAAAPPPTATPTPAVTPPRERPRFSSLTPGPFTTVRPGLVRLGVNVRGDSPIREFRLLLNDVPLLPELGGPTETRLSAFTERSLAPGVFTVTAIATDAEGHQFRAQWDFVVAENSEEGEWFTADGRPKADQLNATTRSLVEAFRWHLFGQDWDPPIPALPDLPTHATTFSLGEPLTPWVTGTTFDRGRTEATLRSLVEAFRWHFRGVAWGNVPHPDVPTHTTRVLPEEPIAPWFDADGRPIPRNINATLRSLVEAFRWHLFGFSWDGAHHFADLPTHAF